MTFLMKIMILLCLSTAAAWAVTLPQGLRVDESQGKIYTAGETLASIEGPEQSAWRDGFNRLMTYCRQKYGDSIDAAKITAALRTHTKSKTTIYSGDGKVRVMLETDLSELESAIH